MNDRYQQGKSFTGRPKDWDEKYGPWGYPEGYTPPMTVVSPIQNPRYLRIAGVIFAFMAVGIDVTFIVLIANGYSMQEISLPIIITSILCTYMSVWCFYLAARRSKWLRDRSSAADNTAK